MSRSVLEERFQGWMVPSDVREAVRRAIGLVTSEGVNLVEATVGDQVAIAVQGQPAALYVTPSGVSVALDPVAAQRAHRSDSVLGLEKESEATWIVHCRYGRMDSARLNSITALMTKALRRYAPTPAPRQAPTRSRRRSAGAADGTGSQGGSRHAPTSGAGGRRTAEERQRAAEAAIPRCPVPGCNLPMVGGSCGFHD